MTGPTGAGTALVGAALAARLRARFVDGAELREVPRRLRDLRQADAGAAQSRWLDAVAAALTEGTATVVASPLLARRERDRLRQAAGGLYVVELVADSQTATGQRRLSRRQERRLAAEAFDRADAPLAAEPLASDERGVRVADDADLSSVVNRIANLLTAAR
ncbi:MAG: hypothetical protein QM677_07650 [Microbacterium sp.]